MDKNCKLVKDLLPSYIDNVTSKETKEFVEEHLKDCKDCKKHFDEMNSELDKEKVKDIETVKEIKKYKRKIFTLKFLVVAAILIIVGIVAHNLGYKYYVVKNTIKANVNNNEYSNIRIEEYEESIEKYEDYQITYLANQTMKKVYKDKCLEYWAEDEHYYIDNENKTYYIVNEPIFNMDKYEFNYNVNIDINAIPEMKEIIDEEGENPLNILKFILITDDLVIQEEEFRSTKYYIIKDALENKRIYVDKETFLAQKVQYSSQETKEYRMLIDTARWHDVTKPDLTGYTKIDK